MITLHTKMSKLSPTQREIIDCMKNGWELGTSMMIDGGSWLQKGGLGHGGEHRKVSTVSVHALQKLGLIIPIRGFPTQRWKLARKLTEDL